MMESGRYAGQIELTASPVAYFTVHVQAGTQYSSTTSYCRVQVWHFFHETLRYSKQGKSVKMSLQAQAVCCMLIHAQLDFSAKTQERANLGELVSKSI